jgi:hypothetical protein
MTSAQRLVVCLFAALAAACGNPVALGNRPCPCAEGYTCCAADRCVLGTACGNLPADAGDVAPAAADAAGDGAAGGGSDGTDSRSTPDASSDSTDAIIESNLPLGQPCSNDNQCESGSCASHICCYHGNIDCKAKGQPCDSGFECRNYVCWKPNICSHDATIVCTSHEQCSSNQAGATCVPGQKGYCR